MTEVPELRTERLRLRGWRDGDLDAWSAIAADPEVARWVGQPGGADREGAWRLMAFFAGHWALRGYGQWVLEERATGELVGRAGLMEPEGWPGLEVGWLITRSRWGNGYAPEAAGAAIKWAREALGATHVISCIADDNHRSERVARKLGMEVEGRTVLRGQWDVRVFGLDL